METRKHGLGLGVAEAAVELQDLHAVRGDDETGVEHAAVVDPTPAEGGHHRLHDLLHGGVYRLLLEARYRAVAAHAAGVGSLVAGEDAFVVLRRSERQGGRAVTEHQQ